MNESYKFSLNWRQSAKVCAGAKHTEQTNGVCNMIPCRATRQFLQAVGCSWRFEIQSSQPKLTEKTLATHIVKSGFVFHEMGLFPPKLKIFATFICGTTKISHCTHRERGWHSRHLADFQYICESVESKERKSVGKQKMSAFCAQSLRHSQARMFSTCRYPASIGVVCKFSMNHQLSHKINFMHEIRCVRQHNLRHLVVGWSTFS